MMLNRGFLIFMLALAGHAADWARAETVEEITQGARNGRSEKDLLRAVERSEEGFALTWEQGTACKQAGVPDSVVCAMIRNPARPSHTRSWLDHVVFQDWGLTVTYWKLFAYFGTFLFAGRWVVQAYASRKAGRPVTTAWFWILSLVGSAFCLSYWIFGPKHDSVGVLQNLLPAFVAAYNLYLEIRYYRANGVPAFRHGEISNSTSGVDEPARKVEAATSG